MDWIIHVLYLGDITIPKAMGTMGLDMNLGLTAPYLAFLLESGGRKIMVDTEIAENTEASTSLPRSGH